MTLAGTDGRLGNVPNPRSQQLDAQAYSQMRKTSARSSRTEVPIGSSTIVQQPEVTFTEAQKDFVSKFVDSAMRQAWYHSHIVTTACLYGNAVSLIEQGILMSPSFGDKKQFQEGLKKSFTLAARQGVKTASWEPLRNWKQLRMSNMTSKAPEQPVPKPGKGQARKRKAPEHSEREKLAGRDAAEEVGIAVGPLGTTASNKRKKAKATSVQPVGHNITDQNSDMVAHPAQIYYSENHGPIPPTDCVGPFHLAEKPPPQFANDLKRQAAGIDKQPQLGVAAPKRMKQAHPPNPLTEPAIGSLGQQAAKLPMEGNFRPHLSASNTMTHIVGGQVADTSSFADG